MGQPEKALSYHVRSVKIQRETGNVRREGISLRNLGHVYLLLGQPNQALEQLSAAVSIFRRIGDLNSAAVGLEDSARAQRAKGNLVEARNNIEESLRFIETVRARSVSPQLRASYLASMEKAYEFYVDLLMQYDAKDPGKGHDAEALRLSERGRARSLAEMLNEAHVDIRQGVSTDLVNKEREIRQSLNAKAQRQIQLQARKGDQQEIETLTKEISALEDEYRQVQAAIRKNSPQYAALTQPQPLGLKQIQQQLDPNTVLLEYSLGDERSYLWVVGQNSFKTYELPKREQIETIAHQVYESLTARGVVKSLETPAQRKAWIDHEDAKFQEAASDLSRMILAPAATEFGTKRLVIVADGALQYVPFAALYIAGPRPIIIDHEVVSLPSASSLAVQRQNLRNRKPAPNAVAVIADPVFSISDTRLKAHSQAAQTSEQSVTRIIEHLSGTASGQLSIPRLPFTRQEA